MDIFIDRVFNLGVKRSSEFFPYKCPHCSKIRNAAEVAGELPDAVLRRAAASRIGRMRRARIAGPGRPTLARCPGCALEMPSADLRGHRIPCVKAELEKLRGKPIQLAPKDPDPYPNFYLHHIGESEVNFEKGSNHDMVTVDLRKIAEISNSPSAEVAYIRVLGRVVWHDDRKRWDFAPTAAIGRPPLAQV